MSDFLLKETPEEDELRTLAMAILSELDRTEFRERKGMQGGNDSLFRYAELGPAGTARGNYSFGGGEALSGSKEAGQWSSEQSERFISELLAGGRAPERQGPSEGSLLPAAGHSAGMGGIVRREYGGKTAGDKAPQEKTPKEELADEAGSAGGLGRRGSLTTGENGSPENGRKSPGREALTEQRGLPERLSELFCRDARRYDGPFERY